MAIEVSVTGSGTFRGSKSNLDSYSVREAITPLDPSAGSAGVGTIEFGATETADSVFLLDNDIELRDGSRGVASGTVRSLSSGDDALTVTADSILVVLNSTQKADPYTGTLGGAITYYMGLVGLTGGFQIEDDIEGRSVVLPGWNDNVLDSITQLCTAQQIEMSVVYDSIVFRKPRTNTAITTRKKSNSFSIDRGNPALSVEVNYYNYSWSTNALIYPSPLENDSSGFQVDVSEQLEPARSRVSASLVSVNQPTPTLYLPPNYTGGSAYTVIGSDGLPIPPAEWTAKGGRVTVEIDPDDSSTIIWHVTGMNEPNDPRAPYRVGVLSSGDNTLYSALYVTGTGAIFDKKTLTVYTGATNTQVAVGATIDNRNISTLEQALTAVQPAVLKYSGMNYTITGDAVSINREGVGNEFATSKLQAFDDEFEGQTLQALDDRNWLFADFDKFFSDLVANQFENQLFGNAGGVRIPRGDAWFRADTATTTESSVSYSASLDTLWADWDAVYGGKMLADWDETWEGHLLKDWDAQPIRVLS